LSTFRLQAPRGWSAIATADAVLAIRRDEPVAGGFRANVLVNVHRLPRTAEPDGDLDRLLDGDVTLPSFESSRTSSVRAARPRPGGAGSAFSGRRAAPCWPAA